MMFAERLEEKIMLKLIGLSLFVLLESAGVWILFHAALYNHLPTDVARVAWWLGGCVIATTISILVLEFQNRQKPQKGNE